MPDPGEVRTMFARIAGRYDLLNHLLSAGIDRRWRRRAVERAGDVRGRVVVDACCGTGALTRGFARRGARAVGVDFTPEMLRRARPQARTGGERALFVEGDALRLPVADGVADWCSVAFGLRNVAQRGAALAEMVRACRPGGGVLVLEFTTPRGRVFGRLYRSYFSRVLPSLGRWISRHPDAYSYLPRTVRDWPAPPELRREMEQAGLVDCGFELLTGGIACLHWGRVPLAR